MDIGHLLPNKKRAVGLNYFTTNKRPNGGTRNREIDEEYRRKNF